MKPARATAKDREDERQRNAKREAAYWVRVMSRLHRMQNYRMSQDPKVQELMRNHQDRMEP